MRLFSVYAFAAMLSVSATAAVAKSTKKVPKSLKATATATVTVDREQVKSYEEKKKPDNIGFVLPTTTVSAKRYEKIKEGSISTFLKDEVERVDVVSGNRIRKTNAFSVSQALDGNAGFAMQSECSACGINTISINSLPGRYVTYMVDSVPIFSASNGLYNADYMGISSVDRIEVSRGAGNAGVSVDALSGVVNVITKKPTQNEFQARVEGGSFGSRNGSAYMAQLLNGGAVTLNTDYQARNAVDTSKTGISQSPAFTRLSTGLGYFIDNISNFKVRGRLDFFKDERVGGTTYSSKSTALSSADGNPFSLNAGPNPSPYQDGWVNPSDGGKILYDSGLRGFSHIVDVNRQQLTFNAQKPTNSGTFTITGGAANHEQSTFYGHSEGAEHAHDGKGENATRTKGGQIYNSTTQQLYLEANQKAKIGKNILTFGANIRHEQLRSQITADGKNNDGLDNYSYTTPGVFAQNYRAFFDEKVETNLSARYDNNNRLGGVFSPRGSVLWNHSQEFKSRFAVGRGSRFPTTFAELEHGILTATRIVKEIRKPEISDNASYTFSYSADRLSFNVSYNYNRIKNVANLHPNAKDMFGNRITLVRQSDHDATVQGFDAGVSYMLTTRLTASFSGEYSIYDFKKGTYIFPRPTIRTFTNIDYDVGNFDFFARLTWTGRQDLEKFRRETYYNYNGSTKITKSPAFFVLDTKVEYKGFGKVGIYGGVNNVFNYTQAQQDSLIWINRIGEADTTNLWGPTVGRLIYIGLRVKT